MNSGKAKIVSHRETIFVRNFNFSSVCLVFTLRSFANQMIV